MFVGNSFKNSYKKLVEYVYVDVLVYVHVDVLQWLENPILTRWPLTSNSKHLDTCVFEYVHVDVLVLVLMCSSDWRANSDEAAV